MKAIVLLGTLKREGLSHTETLVEFFTGYLQKKSVDFEVVKLVRHHILPGTYSNMGEGDDWPAILEKITAADILIFATPIWWGNHSSETQRAIERLDELHDEIMEGKPPGWRARPQVSSSPAIPTDRSISLVASAIL
ncbi:flavodoxin family protein [Taibaiella helva]|uniref:flavodoxin family protein n=1 Tax=Taibaiella helva TaxID=2301235 RepID=UPI0018E50D5F|nr:NAD(P)H-dependent oxidoreductase [Taibaiella helva]